MSYEIKALKWEPLDAGHWLALGCDGIEYSIKALGETKFKVNGYQTHEGRVFARTASSLETAKVEADLHHARTLQEYLTPAQDRALEALKLLWAFLEDVATSNPGWMGKLVIQDYGRMSEAYMKTERVLRNEKH